MVKKGVFWNFYISTNEDKIFCFFYLNNIDIGYGCKADCVRIGAGGIVTV